MVLQDSVVGKLQRALPTARPGAGGVRFPGGDQREAWVRNRVPGLTVSGCGPRSVALRIPPDREEQLIARAKDDPEGFGELYDHYFPQIYRYVASRVRSSDLAEDITSEVFFKALRAIGRYRPSGHPFSAWLYQIAVNTITDHYRSRKRTEDSLESGPERPSAGVAVDEQVAQQMGLEEIWQAIDALPDQQRTAMTLKYSQDLPLAEIGKIMGKSEGAIKLLVYRGTASVRASLRPVPVDGENVVE